MTLRTHLNIFLTLAMICLVGLAAAKAWAKPPKDLDPSLILELNKLTQQDPFLLMQSPRTLKRPPVIYTPDSRLKDSVDFPTRPFAPKNYPSSGTSTIPTDSILLSQIKAHSPLNVEAAIGDKVVLELQTTIKPERLNFTWLFNNAPICRTSRCTFLTSKLNPGPATIRLQLHDHKEALEFNFVVNLTFNKSQDDAAEKTFDLTNTISPSSYLKATDSYARTRFGLGYLHKKNLEDIDVLDTFAKKISWNETLRTNSDAVLRFGPSASSQHFLFSNSTVRLERGANQYAIHLKNGLIRSRNLAPSIPNWAILVRGGYEIDGDPSSDLVVQAKIKKRGDVLKTICLRGHCRIRFPKKSLKNFKAEPTDTIWQMHKKNGYVTLKDDTFTYHLLAGESLEVYSFLPSPPKVTAPNGRALSKIIDQTTPEYLFLDAWPDLSTDQPLSFGPQVSSRDLFLDDIKPVSPKPPVFQKKISAHLIKRYLEQSDPFRAFELLSQFPKAYKSRAEYQLVLAHIYMKLHLFQEAANLLSMATARPTTQNQAKYHQALILLADRKYQLASEILQDFEPYQDQQHQLTEFYLGLCGATNSYGFDTNFQKSILIGKDQAYVDLAQEFIEAANRTSLFSARLGLGYFIDSNALQTGDNNPDLATIAINGKGSGMLRAYGTMALHPIDEANVSATYGLKFANATYTDATIEAIGSLTHVQVFSNHQLSLGTKQAPFFRLHFDPYLEQRTRAGQFTIQGFGLKTGLGLPQIPLAPSFVLESSQYQDPSPGNVKVMDPFLDEPTAITDLGGRFRSYLLSLGILSNTSKTLDLDIGLNNHRKTEASSVPSSFEGVLAGLRYAQTLDPYWHFSLELSNESRSFSFSDDKRKDTLMAFKGEVIWQFLPASAINLHLTQKNNQSTRSASSFNRWIYGLAFEQSL